MNTSATTGVIISYLYKYDDNIWYKITSYIDYFGSIIPIYATNYSYGIR